MVGLGGPRSLLEGSSVASSKHRYVIHRIWFLCCSCSSCPCVVPLKIIKTIFKGQHMDSWGMNNKEAKYVIRMSRQRWLTHARAGRTVVRIVNR